MAIQLNKQQMQLKSLQLHTQNLDQAVNFVIDKVKFEYENHSADMSILVNESFHLRTMSGQIDMVIFKLKDDCIYIDIIAGGGGHGILNLNLGSENQFVKSVSNVLDEFAANQNILCVKIG